MMPFMNILVFLAMVAIAAAVVYLSARAVRSVVIRSLTYLAIHIPEPIRPLFDPSASHIEIHPEHAFWEAASGTVMAISTLVFAAYLYDIVTQLWYLFSSG